MVRKPQLGVRQVVDETCSRRWQGINGRDTAGSRYVRRKIYSNLLCLTMGVSFGTRDGR